MKKKILTIAVALMMTSALHAQEYKLAKSTGKLIIKGVDRVSVEGTSGNEIIFSSMDGSREKDSRADGLRACDLLDVGRTVAF